MSTLIFYSAAVALCAISTMLIHTSTSFSQPLPVSGEVKAKLRVTARVLIAVAAISAGMGVFAQVVSAHH